MNALRTEYMYFGSIHQLAMCENRNLHVNSELSERSDVVQYLAAYMDEKKCLKAMYGLYRLKQVRKMFADKAAEAIVAGTIVPHLDYSDAILIGLPKHEIDRYRESNSGCNSYTGKKSS